MVEKVFALRQKICHLITDDEGQDLIEYGLLASLVVIGAIAGIGQVATAVAAMFTNINTTLSALL